MWRFVVDENLSRTTVPFLRTAGYAAEHVRDIGLGGADDQTIFEYAQAHQAIVLTADKDFANIVRFPLGTHHGIMVVRVPDEQPTAVVNREILRTLNEQAGVDLAGLLLVIEIGRTRIRRPPQPSGGNGTP